MSLRLRTVFAGAFAIVIILLTVILSYLIGKESAKTVEKGIGGSLSEVAYQLSEKLDYFMWSRAGEMEVLSKLYAFQSPVNKEEVDSLLMQLQDSIPVFTWVGYLDTQGNVVASTDDILLGQNISQRPVFQNGIQGMFIGDVHDAVLLAKLLPNPTGEPLQFVDISLPVTNSAGETTGVLAAHFSWEWAYQVEQSILAPVQERLKGVEVYVVSKQDNTVLLGPKSDVGTTMTSEALAQAQADTMSWMLENTAEGHQYVTGYAYGDGYENYEGLGWSVLLRQPTDIAFAIVNDLMRYIIIAGLVIAVLFAILGWYLASLISRPLNHIAGAADMLSTGANVEIPAYKRIKDITVLSDSLRRLVNNLMKTESELGFMSDMARHDPLTKLPNRIALDDYITKAISSNQQEHFALSFLYLDLDGFKKVNDTLGHDAGDRLLQEVALRLLDCRQDKDIVIRLGGDEFVVALNTTLHEARAEAEAVANQIIAVLNQPFFIKSKMVHIGCSVGGSVWSPKGGDTSEAIRLADEALYSSKRNGRNRFTFEASGF